MASMISTIILIGCCAHCMLYVFLILLVMLDICMSCITPVYLAFAYTIHLK